MISQTTARQGFPPWGHPRLMVFGDLMLDRYTSGVTERVSPEAPVLVLDCDEEDVRPGGAANVASFLRGLEAEVIVAGVVGNDGDGRTLRHLLEEMGADASAVIVDSGRTTTSKQRLVGRSANKGPHHLLRVDRECRTPLSSELETQLRELILQAVQQCDAVLISDYAKGVCSPALTQFTIATARDAGIPVLVDPARLPDYARYHGATLIAPNRRAVEIVSGYSLSHAEEAPPLARQFRSAWNIEQVVLTLDRDGLAFATNEEQGLVPCRPREVCDVTGAGDMVLAVLGLCTTANLTLQDSLVIANAAAGLEVERFGVVPITREELAEELRGRAGSPKLVTLPEMIRIADQAHRQRRKLVFTNGCFDLLHIGHVQTLQQASALGDMLVVAINSDASVKRLKGVQRPVIPQHDRAQMLAALDCVDHVLICDDDTPHTLLEALQPDVLVKGGTTDHIVGREVVDGYGGLVAQIPALPDRSSSRIIQQLQIAR